MSLRVTPEEFQAFLTRTGAAPRVTTPAVTRVGLKYKNIKTTVGGKQFDSKGEAARWQELRLMEDAGLIADLQDHVPFPITIAGMTICVYVADYVYMEQGVRVVEDFKGMKTKEYALKKKLLRATWGIAIREVKRRK